MALDATAIIRLDLQGQATHSRIVNASPRGMLLVMPDARPVGTRIHINVQLENPPREIKVSGIIVRCDTSENINPRFSAHAGILITSAGPDWAELCMQLTQSA